MLHQLSWMFLIVTLFFLPVFYFYNENDAKLFSKSQTVNPVEKLAVLTIGNLGGASVVCE